MEQDATINFANLNSRQLLEFEVSQLADGTLAASRRDDVLAQVARDPALQAMLRDFEQINARLTSQPDWNVVNLADLERQVLHRIEKAASEFATEFATDLPAPLRLPTTPAPAATGTTGTTGTRWWTNPWSSAVAAAAALVVGLGIGALMMSGSDPGMIRIDGPSSSGEMVAASRLDVSGPWQMESASNAANSGANDLLAGLSVLNVEGPDVAAALDPEVHSTFPDFVAIYSGGPSVMEVPSRVVVASVDGSADAAD